MGAIFRDRALESIIMLCRELCRFRLIVGLSDARPAARVSTGISGSPIVVTVDASGEFFEWRGGMSRHPICDPAGAAAHIAEQVKRCRREAGASTVDPTGLARDAAVAVGKSARVS